MSASEQSASPPSGEAHTGGLLDQLLLIHRDFNRLLMHIGEPHVLAMNGFMLGFHACLGLKGVEDEAYYRFREWLRDVKQELPLEGWHVKYLHDCDNDHVRAIKKLLDLAAEFHAQEQRASGSARAWE